MIARRSARVGIVGAGISGIVAMVALRDAGHEVVAFERAEYVGGLWNNGYDSLHLFTSKQMASFPGYPMPEDYPLFPSGQQFLDYVRKYAVEKGVVHDIRLNSNVVALDPVDHGHRGWTITLGDGTREQFDAVVLANGHFYKPKRRPVYPGSYSGTQIHTVDFRHLSDFAGDSVLIVGAGPSATDIAADAVAAGKRVALSVRSGRYIVPASVGSRTRMDFTLPSATPGWVMSAVSTGLMRVTTGRPEKLGLPAPQGGIRGGKVTQSTLVPYWIQRGKIDVLPEIESLSDRSIRFVDGTTRDFDMIIWANGYEAEVPFAPEGLITWIDGMPARIVGGTLSPDAPNLYYNGWVSGFNSSSQLYSASARLIARMVGAQLILDTPLNRGVFGDEVPSGQLKFELFKWRDLLVAAERRLARATGERVPSRSELIRLYPWAQLRLDP